MHKISDVDLNVEQLATHMRKTLTVVADGDDERRLAARSESHGYAPQTTSAAFGVREFPPLRMQPKFRPSDDDRYHVNDLLRFHDRDFVRNAYRAVLKRSPETEGFRDYLERLRSGAANKLDLLASMRYSPEGERQGVEVEGLRFPFLLRRAGRLPIIGYLVRWATALLRLPVLVQSHTQFSAYTTAQLEHAAEHINDMGGHFSAALHNLTDDLARVVETQRQLQRDIETLAAEQRARFSMVDERFARQEERITEHVTRFDARFEFYGERQEQARVQLGALRQESEILRVGDRLQTLESALQRTRMELTLQENRLRRFFSEESAREEARSRGADTRGSDTDSPAIGQAGSGTQRMELGRHFTDAMYAAFEDRFRGSAAEIKDRLGVYLPLVRRAPAEGDALDLGSGRGEWMELLRAEGRRVRGVDTNRVFVEDCRARGMDVVERDALEYLRGLEAGSLAMISGLHIVEHLPLEALTELIVETARVLRPGGLVLFETPNPENVLVGSLFFYIDPTHRNPLPSLTLRFMLETCGFDRVEVMNLHPYDSAMLPRTDEQDHTTARFNDLFYGAMDYGISGWKPLA